MLYADTDFFLALLKEKDWLKSRAAFLEKNYRGKIWTSPVTLIELFLIARRYGLDPERLAADVSQIAKIDGADSSIFALAATYMKDEGAGVFDGFHAAICGKKSKIISSDKIFDRLGLDRVKLEAA